MPRLLDRYILGELLRVFALSAAVLVLVTAFGAAIKPLATETLMGPMQTAKYIVLAIVPMLEFALPFAAGFAATLVLHRMASDNEILAAAVGGISYRRILLPIVTLGAVLVIVMVLLTQWVIPRFWALMERNLTTDVARLIQATIGKGLPFEMGNMQIWADDLRVQSHPADTGAETRLILSRVAAAVLDSDGLIVTDVTARQGVVDLHRRAGQTYLKLVLLDTVAFNRESGKLARTPRIEPSRAIAVPDAVRDRPIFMTQGQLLRLHKHPDEFSAVANKKIDLAEALREIDVWQRINDRLASTGAVELAGPNRQITVSADRLVRGTFSTADGRAVEIRQIDAGQPVRLVTCGKAVLRSTAGTPMASWTFDLLLYDCQVVDLRTGGAVNHRARLTMPDLAVVRMAGDDLSQLPYEQLLTRAETGNEKVQRHADRLVRQVADLRLQIQSRLLRRYAMCLTAILLLLLGATLGMWLRNTLPLVIYVWAFVPSVLDVILISGGGHMVRDGVMVGGLLVLWSGTGLLLTVLLFAFMRLRRN